MEKGSVFNATALLARRDINVFGDFFVFVSYTTFNTATSAAPGAFQENASGVKSKMRKSFEAS